MSRFLVSSFKPSSTAKLNGRCLNEQRVFVKRKKSLISRSKVR
ncbi:Uncharacterised protein [Vibrio cholerae]|nr:Uncharacterised protein [Vibrio cholerae]